MDRLIALPGYDAVAYLMPGIVALAACDLIYGTRLILRNEWNIAAGTLAVVAAYIIGHMLSTGAGLIFDRGIVGNLMKPPIIHVMHGNQSSPPEWVRVLFSPHFKAEPDLQKTIKAKKPTAPTDPNELFREAYSTAKQDKDSYQRIVTFLQLYSFCRNLSFTAFLAAIALVVQIVRQHERKRKPIAPEIVADAFPGWTWRPKWQLVAWLAIAIVFFHRYLYMYHVYTIEVLTSYAYSR